MNDIVKTDDDLSTITIDTLKKWGSDRYLDIYFKENIRPGETNFVKLGLKLIKDEKYNYFFSICQDLYDYYLFKKRQYSVFEQYIIQLCQILDDNKLDKVIIDCYSPGISLTDLFLILILKGDEPCVKTTGDFSLIKVSGYHSRIFITGDCSNIISKGLGSNITSPGYHSQIISLGNNANITSSGEGSQIISLGLDSKITVSGDCSKIVAIGSGSNIIVSGKCCKIILGEKCSLSLSSYNKKNERYSFTTIREGENGIKAFVPYQLNENGEVVEVQENANAES